MRRPAQPVNEKSIYYFFALDKYNFQRLFCGKCREAQRLSRHGYGMVSVVAHLSLIHILGKVFGEDVPAEVREEIIAGLRANFEGECSEVGMYPVSYTHLDVYKRQVIGHSSLR